MDNWDQWQDENNMPQHTPNKLSKLEDCTSTALHETYTGSTSLYDTYTSKPSLHETCANSYEVESNVENDLIDLENEQISKYVPKNGHGTTGVYQASQTPYMSYTGVQSVSTSSIEKPSCFAGSTQSDINRLKCSNLPSTVPNNDSYSSLSDHKFPQELSSQDVQSQQPVLSSSNVSKCSRGTCQDYGQDSQIDPSTDQGYGSHSAGSSCQGQDSQREGSVLAHGSQMDLGMEESGWFTGNGTAENDTPHSENELEDLLYHFQIFFHDRFESEFRRYQDAVYAITLEQQDHVRQIVHTAIREHYTAQRTDSEEVESEVSKNEASNSAGKSDISFTQMLDTEFYIPLSCPSVSLPNSSVLKEEMFRKRLLELYSLSCSVSTLLTKRQFKT